jgi:hypothetical protein
MSSRLLVALLRSSAFPRVELQTRALHQPVPDRFSRPLHLWPNGGATAETLRPARVSEAFADERSGVGERPAAGF